MYVCVDVCVRACVRACVRGARARECVHVIVTVCVCLSVSQSISLPTSLSVCSGEADESTNSFPFTDLFISSFTCHYPSSISGLALHTAIVVSFAASLSLYFRQSQSAWLCSTSLCIYAFSHNPSPVRHGYNEKNKNKNKNALAP